MPERHVLVPGQYTHTPFLQLYTVRIDPTILTGSFYVLKKSQEVLLVTILH